MSTPGPENRFAQGVARLVPPGIYRMKNHNSYNGGIPDWWFSGVRDLWVEFKFIQIPVRGETRIDLCDGSRPSLSALQQQWLKGRHAEGRNVAVIVGSALGGVWLPGLTWNTPMTASMFRSALATKRDLSALIEHVVGLPHEHLV